MDAETARFHQAINAMENVDTAQLERLFSEGLDPNFIEDTQGRALLTDLPRLLLNDMSTSEMIDFMKIILSAGGDPNIVNSEGKRPLHYSRSLEMIELLVDHGATLDAEVASFLAHQFHGRRAVCDYLNDLGVEYGWEDSLHQVFNRCLHAADDGLNIVEILTGATPIIAEQVAEAQASLAGRRTPGPDDPLEVLYALNRTNDQLIEGLIPADRQLLDTAWGRPAVTMPEYQRLMRSFGLEIVAFNSKFLPIYHEIVVVDPDEDPDFMPQVEEEFWPAVTLDISSVSTGKASLVFSRAGVRVRAGKNHIEKETAENSMLYWAYHRSNRQHKDLSHDWGSSSEWGTSLKMDVVTDTHHRFNLEAREYDDRAVDLAVVNERVQAALDTDWLTYEEAISLVTNRSLVRKAVKPGAPWAYRYFIDVAIPPA